MSLVAAGVRIPSWIFVALGWIRHQPKISLFHTICSWDCGLYLDLSRHLEPHSTFPLFSWLSGIVARLVHDDDVLPLFLVSFVFSVLAGMVTLHLGELLWKKKNQNPAPLDLDQSAWILLIAVSFFEHNYFWNKPYNETLFYTLYVAGTIFVWSEQWEWAAVVLGVSALVKPQGVFVAAVLVFCYCLSVRTKRTEVQSGHSGLWRRMNRSAPVVGLAIAPSIGLLIWNRIGKGSYFYFIYAQSKGWSRDFAPWAALKSHFNYHHADVIYVWLGLIVAVLFLRRRTVFWQFLGLSTLLLTELPLFFDSREFGPFYSYNRFMNFNLGVFVWAAEIFTRFRILFWIWLVIELTRLAWNTDVMMTGSWMG